MVFLFPVKGEMGLGARQDGVDVWHAGGCTGCGRHTIIMFESPPSTPTKIGEGGEKDSRGRPPTECARSCTYLLGKVEGGGGG